MTAISVQNQQRQISPPAQFRADVQSLATRQLETILGSEKGKAAAVRVGLAFAAAARASRDPSALYRCSRESVASAVAMSALTNLMPGGPAPAVWLVPKGGDLQWWLSHRGIASLCLRAGYQVLPVAVSRNDDFRIDFGEVSHHSASEYPTSADELAGVYLTIRRLDSGVVLCRPWVPVSAILTRRKASAMPNKGPWVDWFIEMAQKTAIKWAFSRGLLPMDGIEISAAIAADGGESHPVPVYQDDDSIVATEAPEKPATATNGEGYTDASQGQDYAA